MSNTIIDTNYKFPGQKNIYKGKVREVYTLENNLLLMVANVSAQANVLCHKDTNLGGRWQVLCRE